MFLMFKLTYTFNRQNISYLKYLNHMINEDNIMNNQQEISHVPLINKVFSSEKTKCIKNKDGFYACVNSKC